MKGNFINSTLLNLIILWVSELLPGLSEINLLLDVTPIQNADEILSHHISTNFEYDIDTDINVSSPKLPEGDPMEGQWDPGSPGTSGLNGNYNEDMEAIGPANIIPDIKPLEVKVEKSDPDDHFDPIVACIMNHKKIEKTGKLIFSYFF